MSEHDDTLLDEDLGDEEYDLGNDEEEALLADDYEQSSYKGEEETDDVLDLGVTDALDDLEGDEENVNYNNVTENHNRNDYYEDQGAVEGNFYENQDNEYNRDANQEFDDNAARDGCGVGNATGLPDLREKLQKNAQKDFFIGNGQGMEDDDCEEAKERRNRFQNERTIISPKMNNDIPDSLENVVTAEQIRPAFRGRGRGRGLRGVSRGGRFPAPVPSNFSPRFNGPRGPPQPQHSSFESQRPQFRPMLENRAPYQANPRMNMPPQQIQFGPNNPQILGQFQQFPMNVQGPPQGHSSFGENRAPMMPNQFQGILGPPGGPRMMNRPEFNPRVPMMGPVYSQHNQQPQFLLNQAHFHNQRLPNPNSSMGVNQPPIVQNNPGTMMQGHHRMPMQRQPGPGFMQRALGPPMQGLMRPPMPPNQMPVLPNHPNAPNMPNQVPFDNMQPYQNPHFARDARPMFDNRPVYNEQSRNQYANDAAQQPPQQPPQQSSQRPSQQILQPLQQPSQPTGNVTNVTLPQGHKILINPHFRGAVQPSTDARLVWDSANQAQQQHQQPPPPPPSSGVANPYNQSANKFQNQGAYGQVMTHPQTSQVSNFQQTKSDDPYAYFSDVWQENKSPKTPNTSGHHSESNYSRQNNHNDYGQSYKSQNEWESRDDYQLGQRDQQIHRDRDSQRSSVDRSRESRVPSANSSYRSETYNQNRPQRDSTTRLVSNSGNARGPIRPPQKRSPDRFSDRGHRDISPKRTKVNSRNLQEVKTIDTMSDMGSEKKEDENEDPEMREYRKKLEEQKRARERFLREKENRRKIAAMEKQYDEQKGEQSGAEEPRTETKAVSVVTNVAKDVKNRPMLDRGRSRPVSTQPTENSDRAPALRIVRTVQTGQTSQPSSPSNENSKGLTSSTSPGVQGNWKVVHPQPGTRRVVIQTPVTQKIATTIQKTVSNLQKCVGNAQRIVVGEKAIVKKTPGSIQKTVMNTPSGGNILAQQIVVNAQNNQRVVLKKALPSRKPELKTNVVRIDNLAASTSEAQLRRMCQCIGGLESVHMTEGSARIVFKTQSAALAFHKKYQRKMLDLSLITVHLVPPTGANKAIATSAKKS